MQNPHPSLGLGPSERTAEQVECEDGKPEYDGLAEAVSVFPKTLVDGPIEQSLDRRRLSPLGSSYRVRMGGSEGGGVGGQVSGQSCRLGAG